MRQQAVNTLTSEANILKAGIDELQKAVTATDNGMITAEDRDRATQLFHMRKYLLCLNLRIERLKKSA